MSAVRAAVPQDVEVIAACHIACWREAYTQLLSPEFLAALDPVARATLGEFPSRHVQAHVDRRAGRQRRRLLRHVFLPGLAED